MTAPEREFEPVGSLKDLPEGIASQRILSSGETVASSAPEQVRRERFCTMSIFDVQGESCDARQCAWHGARFDCRTGESEAGSGRKPAPVSSKIEGERFSSDHGRPERTPVRARRGEGRVKPRTDFQIQLQT